MLYSEVEDHLEHFGVKGMKWGVRREAKRDATEYAKAKMFYGEGAGNRRKLIKATVDAKTKKDPTYKEAFDHYLNEQDMAKRASQARSERARKDTTKAVAKTSRGVIRVLNGNSMYASAASIALVGAFGVAHKAGIDKVVLDAGKKAYSAAKTSIKAQNIKRDFESWVK